MRRVDRRRRVARMALIAYAALLALSVLPVISPMPIVRTIAAWFRDAGASFVRDGWVEVAMNVVMFVPLSTLLILSFRLRPLAGLAIASGISVAIELTQLALPGRVASLRDILANVVGAVAGYVLAHVILYRERRAPAR